MTTNMTGGLRNLVGHRYKQKADNEKGENGHLQTKDGGLEKILPSTALRRNLPCQYFDLSLLTSRTVRK